MGKLNSVLKEALEEAKPSSEEIKKINISLDEFLKKLNAGLRKMKLNAEAFVGGSFAKKTLVKKDRYDIDVYVRFDKKCRKENLSGLLEKALKKSGLGKKEGIKKIHGSRDYFRIESESWFYFEVVPVLKVSKPEEADNITDLSYYHVKYINKKAKNSKILDEILLAKLFCHANKVYGAESHIKGFSGYAVELLVYYYKSFAKFLKAMARAKTGKGEKTIIDIEKRYKNKSMVMMDVNSSKLESPIILIDPTYKQRNALATLSYETLSIIKGAAEEFLKNPKIEDFRVRDMDFGQIEKLAKSRHEEFLRLGLGTDMQEGAIAGSKLLKFYNHLAKEISKSFDIKDKGFSYGNEKSADCYFIAGKRAEIVARGPPKEKKDAVAKFKKRHKKTFCKGGIFYSEEKTEKSITEFVREWKNKNRKIIKDMYITKFEIH